MIQYVYRFILSIFISSTWRHVDTAVAVSKMDNGYNYRYYVLKENNFGIRAVEEYGENLSSNYALQCKVKVREWKLGGELPHGFLIRNTDPAILWIPDYEKNVKKNTKVIIQD